MSRLICSLLEKYLNYFRTLLNRRVAYLLAKVSIGVCADCLSMSFKVVLPCWAGGISGITFMEYSRIYYVYVILSS